MQLPNTDINYSESLVVFLKKLAFYLYVYPYCSKLREPNPFQMQTFLGIQTTIAKARNKSEEGLGDL